MISVCLTTYNGEKYILSQLRSILSQLGKEDEVVVADDHSEDRTVELIEGLHCPQIRVLRNTKNLGYTKNFERVLQAAKGDIIFLSDQDDIWFPDKVERCLAALERADFVVHDAQIVSADERLLYPSFYALRKPYATFWGNVWKFGYLGCCMCMKRSVRDKALPFPSNYRYCTHDNWLFLVASGFFHTKVLKSPLIKYRRHGENASDGQLTNETSLAFKLAYRAYLLWRLFLRGMRRV